MPAKRKAATAATATAAAPTATRKSSRVTAKAPEPETKPKTTRTKKTATNPVDETANGKSLNSDHLRRNTNSCHRERSSQEAREDHRQSYGCRKESHRSEEACGVAWTRQEGRDREW
jgi:hypothetical protein